jgi:hypothetical protein
VSRTLAKFDCGFGRKIDATPAVAVPYFSSLAQIVSWWKLLGKECEIVKTRFIADLFIQQGFKGTVPRKSL